MRHAPLLDAGHVIKSLTLARYPRPSFRPSTHGYVNQSGELLYEHAHLWPQREQTLRRLTYNIPSDLVRADSHLQQLAMETLDMRHASDKATPSLLAALVQVKRRDMEVTLSSLAGSEMFYKRQLIETHSGAILECLYENGQLERLRGMGETVYVLERP
jgi:hypothetical protein